LTKLLALAKKTETLYQKTCKERDFVFPCWKNPKKGNSSCKAPCQKNMKRKK
jgi:hypothetical protein